MKILRAGWGDVPGDVRFDIAVNMSRILARTKCGELHGYVYEDNRVPDRETSPALHLGTAWHDALERLAAGETVNAIIADYRGEEWLEDKHGNTEQRWFEHTLAAYYDHYGSTSPCGKILATEVPLWMVAKVGSWAERAEGMDKDGIYRWYPLRPPEHDEALYTVLVRGRFDRLCDSYGALANGEIKTAAAGTNMANYMALRSAHIQDALYYLALSHTPPTLPDGTALPADAYGTRYDITQKYSVPKGRRKDKSDLPGLLAAWKEKLFYTDGVSWTAERATAVAGKGLSDYIALAGTRHRNLSACDTYGQCSYFDVCHGGLSLDSAHFKDREADYVDDARL